MLQEYMKKFFICLLLVLFLSGGISFINPADVRSANNSENLSGNILLQVQKNGEAWYIYPKNGQRYYLGRPSQAFDIMRDLSLGTKHDFIENNEYFPARLSGMILLDVEHHGEAYYIYPKNLKKYYLGRPADAFQVMRDLGLGITDQELASIPAADPQNNQEQQTRVVIPDVPFTPQAPFADWQDQRQQDGCEEASALMAIKWAQGESLSREEALNEILGSSAYTQDHYGEYRDISARDIVDWIIKDYFDHNNARYEQSIQIEDIVSEVKQGNVVLTPMNGQKMENPHFTPPGPSRHMVLIRGYDPNTEKFITNDPGTKHGKLYEYDYDIFYNAIRDYPTGYHEPIDEVEKNMIVVEK